MDSSGDRGFEEVEVGNFAYQSAEKRVIYDPWWNIGAVADICYSLVTKNRQKVLTGG